MNNSEHPIYHATGAGIGFIVCTTIGGAIILICGIFVLLVNW